jgi:FkbM family methyltransferase
MFPVTAPYLLSYAQNGEDVVLWRALHGVANGRYVEVGANSPTVTSITKSFYDAGWSGVTIEPVPEYADEHRAQRPRDTLLEVAITADPVDTITLYDIPETGLSTTIADISNRHRENGLQSREIKVSARSLRDVLAENLNPGADIHFMTVDTEGSERTVLESMDFVRWRPWVLVIEATVPRTNIPNHEPWESLVLSAGYQFCLFDGLSRYYVADERADELKSALSYPACALDTFKRVPTEAEKAVRDELAALREQVVGLNAGIRDAAQEVVRWRAVAIEGLTNAAPPAATSPDAQQELEAMRRTISWRLTAPLRRLRPRMNRPVAIALKVRSRARSGR